MPWTTIGGSVHDISCGSSTGRDPVGVAVPLLVLTIGGSVHDISLGATVFFEFEPDIYYTTTFQSWKQTIGVTAANGMSETARSSGWSANWSISDLNVYMTSNRNAQIVQMIQNNNPNAFVATLHTTIEYISTLSSIF